MIREIGRGSFGIVFLAEDKESKQQVAIKKVVSSSDKKNKEIRILQLLQGHPNIVQLVRTFEDESVLKPSIKLKCMIFEAFPQNLLDFIWQRKLDEKAISINEIKLITVQLFQALKFIHGKKIAHRDIKPQNILINPESLEIKICDFGSAKKLTKGERNAFYICSRYYRAPELLFGANDYEFSIDIWAVGCVIAELILSTPLFRGTSSVDQIVKIISVLGTPTKQQIALLNPDLKNPDFPEIAPKSWKTVFSNKIKMHDDSLYELLSQCLAYEPCLRLSSSKALQHDFFKNIIRNSSKFSDQFDYFIEEKVNKSQSLVLSKTDLIN